MYASKDKYRNPSPPHRNQCPLRRLADEVPQETPDPMGLAESTSMKTSNLRGDGTRNVHLNPVGSGTRNARRSPAGAGMMYAAAMMLKAATEAEVSTEKGAGSLREEARSLINPHADLHLQHLVEGWRRRPEITLSLRIPWPQEGRAGTSKRIQDWVHRPKVLWKADPRRENAKGTEPQATRKSEAL
jgi:hypothetical protein